MSENLFLYLIGSAVAVIIWLVRLEAKVGSMSNACEEHKAKLKELDTNIRVLQTDSALVARSLSSMESELRQIKDFIMRDGFLKLRDEVIDGVTTELRKVI